jgi:hypothetical protein
MPSMVRQLRSRLAASVRAAILKLSKKSMI